MLAWDVSQITFKQGEQRFFDDLVTFLASFAGLSAGLALQRKGESAPFGKTDVISFQGTERGIHKEMRYFPLDVLGELAADTWPTRVEISVGTITNFAPENPFTYAGLVGVAGSMLMSAFVHYYETVLADIKAKHGSDPGAWPATLNFARIVRNAFAHGGTLNFQSPTGLGGTWRGVIYTPADNGRQILFSDLAAVEVILLMNEMDTLF